MEAESLEKETETERPKKDLNEAAVTTSAEVKSSAKNDTLKALKVRGPAWLAFTGKSNVKPDDKLVKPVSVEANGAKQPVKPVSVETNGSTQPVKPVLEQVMTRKQGIIVLLEQTLKKVKEQVVNRFWTRFKTGSGTSCKQFMEQV